MKQAICLYLHLHQPLRIKHYTIFNSGIDHEYFNDQTPNANTNNEFIINKVAHKSYIPANKTLKHLLDTNPEFKFSISITGVLIEQLEKWAPEVLQSFKELTDTGRVEIVAETYHHSLAFFYSRAEFETQVAMHRQKINDVFGQNPQVFRNTELSYNNDLAYWADKAGYKAIIAEGWDPILGWRSPNFMYRPTYTNNIKLMLKNYRLSDDIAFRFSNRNWSEWPLTAEKFVHWLGAAMDNAQTFNLFMDYETFGEHQWEDTGIFEFLKAFPDFWMNSRKDRTFMTLSEAVDTYESKDTIDMPYTVTWADTERDLSAWLDNSMQQQAVNAIYELQDAVIRSNDWQIIEDWRRLQTSDHFYYMCTKWFNDGDVHAYFSPYSNPYDAFTNYMNAWRDLKYRLIEKGIEL
ncbi:glycoside hydrolase family 57 protein [Candidatus Saccharibacteria bacterium]|jgi:alpha-amylase|nr:glycoside hydrolase family 57 protein [Candidatus Saccharibacteria bacterium]HOR23228.1 glycoside hydrolase family 57 protein [Candidatus Saccharibacteria bacterium]HPW48311.1 glycoside hydrolase family 57 protein [Candidatus Saccharibacteria bacterium]